MAGIVFLCSLPPTVNMSVFVPWDLTFGSGMQTAGVLLAVVTLSWIVARPAGVRHSPPPRRARSVGAGRSEGVRTPVWLASLRGARSYPARRSVVVGVGGARPRAGSLRLRRVTEAHRPVPRWGPARPVRHRGAARSANPGITREFERGELTAGDDGVLGRRQTHRPRAVPNFHTIGPRDDQRPDRPVLLGTHSRVTGPIAPPDPNGSVSDRRRIVLPFASHWPDGPGSVPRIEDPHAIDSMVATSTTPRSLRPLRRVR